MKHVLYFDNFLNEYGGPGRKIGFRYTEPNIDYLFSINVVVNPKLGGIKLKNRIKKIFKDHNVGEDYIKIRHLGADEYKLEIKIKGYSKYEVLSMIDFLFKEVYKNVGKNAIFILDSIDVKGKDFKFDDERKPIGFEYPNRKI